MSMSVGGFNSNFNIAANLNNAKGNQSGSASQNGLPSFDHGRVWGSLGDFGAGLKSYQKEWEGVYSDRFSGQDNGGKMTVEEVDELLKSEFSQFGVRFVSSNPRDVSDGQHKVYIDDANKQKMANDPEYRGKVMALMQRELACTQQGFNYQRGGDTIQSPPLTGTVISICQENSAYGGIPYSGMAKGGMSISTSTATTGGKSMLEIIKEMEEERLKKLDEKKEKEALETKRKSREEELKANLQTTDILELSGNASAGEVTAKDAATTGAGDGDGSGAASPAAGTGGGLDVVG